MSKVTIELDSVWVKFAKSPLFLVLSALQGVSITFAPYFLYLSGKGESTLLPRQTAVPLFFAVIFFVPLAYFRLSSAVIRELRKTTDPTPRERSFEIALRIDF
jgi:hypothetical protein